MKNYTRKFDNLDIINQFFKNHKIPQLTQHEVDNLNSSILNKETNYNLKTPLDKISKPRWFQCRILP